jgi:hypothetical protein
VLPHCIIKIIIRNGAKTTLLGRLNNNISAFLNSCNKVPVKECSEEAPMFTGEFFFVMVLQCGKPYFSNTRQNGEWTEISTRQNEIELAMFGE